MKRETQPCMTLCSIITLMWSSIFYKKTLDFSYTTNIGGETPLYIAAWRGYHDLVAVILELCKSPPPDGGPDGSTALHGAVIFRSQGCTRKLVDLNKSLAMETDENGYSPLHYDALFGDYPFMASQLLDADNSVAYLVDNDKNIALHIGVSRGDYHLARKLILSCPDCSEMVNGRRQNILHIALAYKDDFMVECILKNCRGISSLMTQKDEDGNTPLHLMATSNLKVRELIKHAMTDKAALNKQHFTPLDMVAEEHGDLWVRMIDFCLMFKEL
ncbi:unnamed protein product [Ilex paraguariensis]|uniref:Uncharacterized protein n=1 Tax=Ilex paraguariensis TaxID=185542 RepID=A0ABC8RX66_9AQUA